LKCPSYKLFKPSGVEWLGNVPEHWELKRLDFLATVKARLGWKGLTADEYVPEGFIFLATPNIKGEGEIDFTNVNYITAERYHESPEIMVRVGDVLMAKDGSTLGTTNLVRHLPAPTTVNSSIAVLRPKLQIESEFFFRWLTGGYTQSVINSMKDGQGVPHLFQADIKKFPILLPPPVEQRAITEFLDRETGRIDRLVRKQRDLIERLKEKRTALISRTVTRGLPPDAARAAGLPVNPALKPSGAEWLGDIPVHWEVKPVKFIARIGNGSTPSRDNPNYWENGAYPWLNSSVVNQEVITEAHEFVTPLALRECHLPKIVPPAVLIGITGQGRTRGMASTLLFEATINQHVAYLKPYPHHADVGFLRRVFDTGYLFLRSESDGGGSTKGAITCEQIANWRIPIPPLPEQIAIATYLGAETVKLDSLTVKVEAAIERLEEYRTALITAAVTGKIDVRTAAT
jgi:type I restriction enzyme S subunit